MIRALSLLPALLAASLAAAEPAPRWVLLDAAGQPAAVAYAADSPGPGWQRSDTLVVAPRVPTSVLPVAWRRAMRATPAPDGSGPDALVWLLAQSMSVDQRDALEYMVRAERGDLLAAGLPAAFVDAVMLRAAAYPGSDPVYGP